MKYENLESEHTPSLETRQPKKTVKKSTTIKRPTDLSWLQKNVSKIGKRMPFGNSKPKSRKTGPTPWEWPSPFIGPITGRGTSTTPSRQYSTSSKTAKSFQTTPPSMFSGYQQFTVDTTKPTRGLKQLLRKCEFYIVLVIFGGLSFWTAKDFCDSWFTWGAFYIALWFGIKTVVKWKSN